MALSVPMGMEEPRVRVLLGSGGVATDDRRETYRRLVGEHFSGCTGVLFVPFASSDHALYTSRMQGFTGPDGPELVGIESLDDPVSAVSDAEGIYVGGGNSFLLVRELHESGLMEPIREAVMGGVPYLGVSAGSNVACPSMMTTNDMPIVHPPSFSSLGVVPFQINPHYHPGKIRFMDGDELSEHFGESRAQRISEFHLQDETPVLGMWEGSFAHWDGTKGVLTGRATAFRAGEEPIEMHDGMEFDSTLSPC
jgi:dipeptidase E